MKIYRVTAKIWRGARPFCCADFKNLKESGITAVVCLEDDLAVIASEKTLCEQKGLKFFSYPMSEIDAPSVDELRKNALEIWKLQKDEVVYVHCRRGKDRTGYVIAAFRILIMGWTFDHAFKECKKFGHSWWFPPYWGWPKVLKKLAKEAKGEKEKS